MSPTWLYLSRMSNCPTPQCLADALAHGPVDVGPYVMRAQAWRAGTGVKVAVALFERNGNLRAMADLIPIPWFDENRLPQYRTAVLVELCNIIDRDAPDIYRR